MTFEQIVSLIVIVAAIAFIVWVIVYGGKK